MGVCKSKTQQKSSNGTQSQNEALFNQNSQNNNTPNTKSDAEFSFNTSNFVMEKFGKITKEYTLLNPPLGKGAFGEVRKAIHKPTGILRAVKLLCKQNLTEDDQEKLINEVEILKKLDHPNIIKVLEFYQDDQFFYIVTELCSGGELFDKIIEEQFFSEKKAALIMKQILSAVFYCHENKIVHRDLKPENLLFESNKEGSPLKVIDFGTSRVFDPSRKMDQKFGTPYYIAPEVLKKRYDEKCDIWSCGVILYIMLSGNPPFNGPNDKVIMSKVQSGKYSFEGSEWNQVSNDAKEFIKRMLEYDSEKRLNAEMALKDKWMTKFAAIKSIDQPLMQKTLQNMHAFRANHKLQEASWMFLVQYFTTKEEKNQLMKRFQAIDTNGDGVLQREELIEAYKKFLPEDEATEQVDQIMQQIDKNNSGCIDYTEFVMATCNRQNMLSKDKLEVAFKMFDKDNSGALDISELKNVFRGANVTDQQWNDIIKEVDENKDGQIQFLEFKKMMLKLLDVDNSSNNKH